MEGITQENIKVPNALDHILCIWSCKKHSENTQQILLIWRHQHGGNYVPFTLLHSFQAMMAPRRTQNGWRYNKCGKAVLLLWWCDPDYPSCELRNCVEIDSKEFQLFGSAQCLSRYISSPILSVTANDFVPTRRDRVGDPRRTIPFQNGSVDSWIHADTHDLRK